MFHLLRGRAQSHTGTNIARFAADVDGKRVGERLVIFHVDDTRSQLGVEFPLEAQVSTFVFVSVRLASSLRRSQPSAQELPVGASEAATISFFVHAPLAETSEYRGKCSLFLEEVTGARSEENPISFSVDLKIYWRDSVDPKMTADTPRIVSRHARRRDVPSQLAHPKSRPL